MRYRLSNAEKAEIRETVWRNNDFQIETSELMQRPDGHDGLLDPHGDRYKARVAYAHKVNARVLGQTR